ncbi:MAG: hypothetical protein MJ138_07335 [Kiritimatiellae bacterium]|nr:hypothetical protein [Kiritimatiellia bacterium]
MDEELHNDSGQPTNAVSLFAQGGATNDFPVLKAFQEYIDAEQTKARKRMLGLSIFFVVLLMVVVSTFAVILVMLVNSKQTMMDRLLDMAMKEKPAAAEPASGEVAKLNDKIAALQEKLMQQQLERERAEQAARIEKLREDQTRQQREQAAREQKLREDQARQQREQAAREEKLRQEQDALKRSLAEQKKAMAKELAAQRAELETARKNLEASRKDTDAADAKAAERERFLRRQYPDYYAKVDAAKKRTENAKNEGGEAVATEPKKVARKAAKVPSQEPAKKISMQTKADEASQAANLDEIKPIDYFSESIESIDVENGDDDVPFLINNPSAGKPAK